MCAAGSSSGSFPDGVSHFPHNALHIHVQQCTYLFLLLHVSCCDTYMYMYMYIRVICRLSLGSDNVSVAHILFRNLQLFLPNDM